MKINTLQSEAWVPRPREEVFDFFSRAENLEVLMPPWLNFSISSPRSLEMKTGTRIQYRLRLHGIPLRWESEITAWEPTHRFVDEQRSGPYRLWIHEHQFSDHKRGFDFWSGWLLRYRTQAVLRGGGLAAAQRFIAKRGLLRGLVWSSAQRLDACAW